MNTRGRTLTLIAALAAFAAGAYEVPRATAQATGDAVVTGRLWIEGGSTVRSWDCEAGALEVTLTAVNGSDLALDGLGDAVSGLDVRVPSQALDCDDGTMNGHMRDALEVEKHRTIEFRMDGYEIVAGDAGPRVEVTGTLQLHGVTRGIKLRAELAEETEGLRVRGMHVLDMKDYGVDPPRLMWGALRVHEDVEVHFDLLMATDGASPGR